MPTIKINGIDVDFPFVPYACQQLYMEKVINCLENGTNGLLESPTGTGKTLCLLCATLGWRRHKLTQKINEHKARVGCADMENADETYKKVVESSVPKVIYASRTHSQLSQVVRELRKTVYKPYVCVLGSREQLCIHETISKLRGNAQNAACRKACSSGSCSYMEAYRKRRSDENSLTPLRSEICDIEELSELMKKHSLCPFYFSRDFQQNAEIVFMPYNYLIDARIRKSLSISCENRIMVIDEAHNITSWCEDAASFEITNLDISNAVKELDNIIEKLRSGSAGVQADFIDNAEEEMQFQAKLKEIFLGLEEHLDKISLNHEGSFTAHGAYIYDFLQEVNITTETISIILEILDRGIRLLNDTGEETLEMGENGEAIGGRDKEGGGQAAALQKFQELLVKLFPNNQALTVDMVEFYRVHVAKTVPQRNFNARSGTFGDRDREKESMPYRTLSFWCFSGSIAMRNLMSQGPHSLIMASGTLSPLDAFQTELQIPFKERLQNTHVIDPHQVGVLVAGKGPSGHALNSSFRCRDTPEYKRELGNFLINVIRVIPDGVLIFFPSYTVMDQCVSYWKRERCSGTTYETFWQAMAKVKHLIEEPRGSQAMFAEAAESYTARIKLCKRSSASNSAVTAAAANGPKGACFFSVCRGKASEGLDFADEHGRAVIIVGIPFAPAKDPRVVLKQSFLDTYSRRTAGSALGGCCDGKAWYTLQASMAVNQAVGRVIRHRNDYGFIILADERFGSERQRNTLSMWLRKHFRVSRSFQDTMVTVSGFFRTIKSLEGTETMSTTTGESGMSTGSASARARPKRKRSDGSQKGIIGYDIDDPSNNGGRPDSSKFSSDLLSMMASVKTGGNASAKPNLPPQNSTNVGRSGFYSVQSAGKSTTTATGFSAASLEASRSQSAAPLVDTTMSSRIRQFQRTQNLQTSAPSIIPTGGSSSSLSSSTITGGESSTATGGNIQPKRIDEKRSIAAGNVSRKKHENAKQFIEEVKRVLSENDYKRFKRILYEAKSKVQQLSLKSDVVSSDETKRNAMNALFQQVKDLFMRKESGDLTPEKRSLLHGFHLFLPPKFRTIYEKFVSDIPEANPKQSATTNSTAKSLTEISGGKSPATPANVSMSIPTGVKAEERRERERENDTKENVERKAQASVVTKSNVPESDEDNCPVCQCMPTSPFQAKCGHVCCHTCWLSWLERYLECPICRNRTRVKQLRKCWMT